MKSNGMKRMVSILSFATILGATLGSTVLTTSAIADPSSSTSSSSESTSSQDGGWGHFTNSTVSGKTYNYSYFLSLPSGASISTASNGGYLVTTQVNGVTSVWGSISAPTAYDNEGRSLPSTYTLSGDLLTEHVTSIYANSSPVTPSDPCSGGSGGSDSGKPSGGSTTPPSVTAASVTNVTNTTTTLNGTANANGASTSLSFCYSTSPLAKCAGATSVSASPGSLSGTSLTSISSTLTGLLSGKTYYYQVVGVNSAGTTYSNVLSFTTPVLYTVSFNPGGAGAPAPMTGVGGSTITLPVAPPNPGYSFRGWNTAVNGSGTNYAGGATYLISSSITLYAQWAANVTVTFNANGGNGKMVNETNSHGVATALVPNSFTRPGYTFGNWNTAANGSGTTYANDATYPFTSSITLYARWVANVTVTFNANGGNGAMASETEPYNVATSLTANAFGQSGYTVDGWNTAANGSGTAYANGATFPFVTSVTLFAQWVQIPTFSPGNSTITLAPGPTSTVAAPGNDSPVTSFVTETVQGTNSATVTVTIKDSNGSPMAGQSISLLPLNGSANVSPSSATTTSNGQADFTVTDNVQETVNFMVSDTTQCGDSDGDGCNASSDGEQSGNGDSGNGALSTGAQITFTASSETVTFNSNGGSGTMSGETAPYGVATELTDNAFTRSGYFFAGWNTQRNGSGTAYQDDANYSFTSGVTLYAQWTVLTFSAQSSTVTLGPGPTSSSPGPSGDT
ncbi:MAG TPA: InlB B-repeat-containing protein, partial [Acidimicrobiales bacterium]